MLLVAGLLAGWADATGQSAASAYDARGRRISRTDASGDATWYVWDGTHVAEEYDDAGTLQAEYVWGLQDNDQLAVRRADSVGPGTWRYPLQGQTRSVMAVLDQAGQAVERLDYAAYGEPRRLDPATGEALAGGQGLGAEATPSAFHGQFHEAATGLVYLHERWLDPAQGRFLSPSRLEYPVAELNYLFANNNPAGFTDYDGLAPHAAQIADWVDGIRDSYLGQNPTGSFLGDFAQGCLANLAALPFDVTRLGEGAAAAKVGYTTEAGGCGSKLSGLGRGLEAVADVGRALQVAGAVGAAANAAQKVARAGQAAERGAAQAEAAMARATKDGVSSPGCFVAGTPVETATSGSVPIERLRAGDLVMAMDPMAGRVTTRAVVEAYRREGVPVWEVRTRAADGREDVLRTTAEHPFWVPEETTWTAASALAPGRHSCLRADGTTCAVASARATGARATVHNIQVEGEHSYFVGNGRVLVHNAETCPFVPEAYWESLRNRAPEQSIPYNTIPKYDGQGNLKGVTTYDQFGNRAFQYEVSPTARHGAGFHAYDNSGPFGGFGKGPRTDHAPF